jgi:hypothetical protein
LSAFLWRCLDFDLEALSLTDSQYHKAHTWKGMSLFIQPYRHRLSFIPPKLTIKLLTERFFIVQVIKTHPQHSHWLQELANGGLSVKNPFPVEQIFYPTQQKHVGKFQWGEGGAIGSIIQDYQLSPMGYGNLVHFVQRLLALKTLPEQLRPPFSILLHYGCYLVQKEANTTKYMGNILGLFGTPIFGNEQNLPQNTQQSLLQNFTQLNSKQFSPDATHPQTFLPHAPFPYQDINPTIPTVSPIYDHLDRKFTDFSKTNLFSSHSEHIFNAQHYLHENTIPASRFPYLSHSRVPLHVLPNRDLKKIVSWQDNVSLNAPANQPPPVSRESARHLRGF